MSCSIGRELIPFYNTILLNFAQVNTIRWPVETTIPIQWTKKELTSLCFEMRDINTNNNSPKQPKTKINKKCIVTWFDLHSVWIYAMAINSVLRHKKTHFVRNSGRGRWQLEKRLLFKRKIIFDPSMRNGWNSENVCESANLDSDTPKKKSKIMRRVNAFGD